jgi:RNA recognition motif-containing protein
MPVFFPEQVWEDPSMAEWDPNDYRIFCGDLGNEVSDELLAKAFRKYSSFQKAKVCRDSRTNKSKGFGFVSFRSQEVPSIFKMGSSQ